MRKINKNFLLYLFGNNSSVFGDILLSTAMALYVFDQTKSPKLFGSVLAAGYIPRILIGVLSGTFVDRIPKKKLLVALDLLRGFLLIMVVFSGNISITAIYIITITFGIIDTFFRPASVAIIPKIIKRSELTKANSLNSAISSTLTMLSPVIAVFLYKSYGILVVVIIDAATFILSGISELFLKFEDKIDEVRGSFKRDFVSIFSLLKSDKRILSLLINGFLTHLFLTPFIDVGLTSMFLVVFKTPELHYGVAKGVMSGSTILSGILVLLVKNKSISKNINIGIVGMIISVGAFLLMLIKPFYNLLEVNEIAPVIYLSLCSFLIVLSFGYYAVFFKTFYQSEVPENQLGKFISLFMICISAARVTGVQLYGLMFENSSLLFPLITLGIGMVLKLLVHIPFLKAEKELCVKKIAS